jgi:hypothetical protein
MNSSGFFEAAASVDNPTSGKRKYPMPLPKINLQNI